MDDTRISEVRWYAVAVPLGRAIADSQATLSHWTVPVVEVTTNEGLTGTGIGGIHVGAEVLATVLENHYAPRLINQDSAYIRAVWHDLYTSPIQWIGRAGVTHLALGLVDIALWDLAAQRARMPLWQLLGGHHRALQTYNTDGGWLHLNDDELVANLKQVVAQGWSAVKIKVGSPDWRDDVRRLTTARTAIGPEIELSCDANKVWDLHTAQRILPTLEELDIAWLEEPLHPDDVAGHAKLQSLTRVPIACGESLYSRQAFRDFIAADALRIAQLDVTRLGGITEYLEVAAYARTSGVPVIPHAGDMMVVHQHLAASSIATTGRLEYIPWTLAMYDTPVQIDGTTVLLPHEPGASTRVSRSARENWLVPGTAGVLHA
ncbi:mandelate racemase/muconate lactonizing enzyme family protein [Streptomyces sp. NBC_00063]|uniref:mandelate racemase/muconate lactonizing enzyme family protein n=1 Tax=Streptomyces sp. NBC_00063 TaxID=2975638 RepID=UPI003D725913